MSARQLVSFTYTKADGSSSERVVVPISSPSDMMFALDLTEFEAWEREEYLKAINEAFSALEASITEIGLRTAYRNFKKAGIEYNGE